MSYVENDYLDSLQPNKDNEKLKAEIFSLLIDKRPREATELMVKHLKSKKTFFTIRSDVSEEIWIYKEGIYVPEGKTYIKEYCRVFLDDKFTNYLVNEVVSKIIADTYINSKDFFNNSPIDKIPVLNGLLNLKTGELEDFTPAYFFFVKVNAIYDKEKDCPNIKKFFKTLLKEDDIPAMQELFGYCLWKDNFTEKSFLFRADGSNGKSKTMELLQSFLTPDNCVSVPLQQLEGYNNFNIIELHNKLVNLAGELSKSALKETQMFKLLTGRDYVTANRKFLTSLSFVNYSKFIFSCNERPLTYDESDGFFRRWILFYFRNKFVDKNVYDSLDNKEGYCIKDTDIVDKIRSVDEFSGLLNWALVGLHRLLNNKIFSNTKGTEETRIDWLKDSNNFVVFFEKYLEIDKGVSISKSDLRQVYVDYCLSNGLEPVTDKKIHWFLSQKGVSAKRKIRETKYSQERERCWFGIKFKSGCVDALGWSLFEGCKDV